MDKVIERLTPAPTPGTPAGGEGETGDAGDTEEGGAGEAATVVTPVALAAAPAAQATVVAQNQAAAPVVQIADEAAPLAEAVPANTQETVQAGSDKEETKEAVNIEEEASPGRCSCGKRTCKDVLVVVADHSDPRCNRI